MFHNILPNCQPYNPNLSFKEKLEIFKLRKKPRKQIRLRFSTITKSLNLPSVNLDLQTSQNIIKKFIVKPQQSHERVEKYSRKKQDSINNKNEKNSLKSHIKYLEYQKPTKDYNNYILLQKENELNHLKDLQILNNRKLELNRVLKLLQKGSILRSNSLIGQNQVV